MTHVRWRAPDSRCPTTDPALRRHRAHRRRGRDRGPCSLHATGARARKFSRHLAPGAHPCRSRGAWRTLRTPPVRQGPRGKALRRLTESLLLALAPAVLALVVIVGAIGPATRSTSTASRKAARDVPGGAETRTRPRRPPALRPAIASSIRRRSRSCSSPFGVLPFPWGRGSADHGHPDRCRGGHAARCSACGLGVATPRPTSRSPSCTTSGSARSRRCSRSGSRSRGAGARRRGPPSRSR